MNRRIALAIAGLVALTVAVYAGVWSYEFVQFDDPIYIIHNPDIASGLTWAGVKWAFTTGYAANWHPLTWISHMLDIQLFGMQPGPAHAVSLLLHVTNTLLLFGWLAFTTKMIGRSFVVAALFAIHPAHVESVAWIAERKDVLSTLFWMLTMWAYVFYVRKPGVGRYAVVMLALALGLMSKPMLVTLPLVLLLLDVWPLRRFSRRAIVEKLPLLALTLASSIVTFVAQRSGGAVMALETMPVSNRIENALLSYVTYLGKLFWPVRLYMYYAHPPSLPLWQIAACAVTLIVITAIAVRVFRPCTHVTVGWFWYLGTLVPVIGLVQVGRQAMADRYTYVPSIGIFILVVWAASELLQPGLKTRPPSTARLPSTARPPSRRRIIAPAAVACLVIGALSVQARAQVQYWRNDQALWTRALKMALRLDDHITDLAVSDLLSENGLTPLQALLEAREGAPKRLGPATARLFLGQLFTRHRQPAEAVTVLSEGARLAPNMAEIQSGLGLALSQLGRTEEAVAAYRAALQIDPSRADTHNDLGFVLAQQGKLNDALTHFAIAVQLRPDLPDAHRNFGLALANLGRTDEAIREFNEVLRLKPDDVNVRRAIEELQKRGKGGR